MVGSGSVCGGSRNIGRFTVQVLRGRWFMLFASVILMASIGGTYVFVIYSKAIKKALGYDQTTLNLLGFFKYLGTIIGIFAGLTAEVTPNWFVLLVSASLNFVGYFMVWINISGHISKPQIWQMCLYICVGANSQNFTLTSVMVIDVKKFPDNRGTLIGLLKGFTGLSGAVMTQLYLAIYGNDFKSLILFIAWILAVAFVFFAYAIRMFRVTFSHVGYVVTATTIWFLLFAHVYASIKEELIRWKKNLTPKVTCFSYVFNLPESGEDYTILQAMVSIDMLLLIKIWVKIGEYLGYPTLTISTFVSLMSIWNYFGRVGIGLISEIILTKWKFPRTLVLAIFLLISCVGHILIAFLFSDYIYIASVIIGFCYGAHVTLIFTIVSELFGLKYYSTLYNCGILVMPLGSYVFNVRVAGFLYEKEALKQLNVLGLSRDSGKESTCIGKVCYKFCFIILAAVTFIATLASFILFIRTRKFYKGDIYRNSRQETDMANKKSETIKLVSSMDSSTKSKVVG
ncbi:hypothetical protein MKX03_037472 [Papaver bracteatum]|nr:hypothetical protein MKX03_037472 [Papaver bracteatum]